MYVWLTFSHPTLWKPLFKFTSNAYTVPRMATSDEIAIRKNHFINFNIVTLMPEWKRWTSIKSNALFLALRSATNSGDTKQPTWFYSLPQTKNSSTFLWCRVVVSRATFLIFPQRLERNILFQEKRRIDNMTGRWRKKRKEEGQSGEGTTGEGLPQHGHTAGLITVVKGRIF